MPGSVESPDLIRVDRHVDVGGEDSHQERDQPPAAETCGPIGEEGDTTRYSARPLTATASLWKGIQGGIIARYGFGRMKWSTPAPMKKNADDVPEDSHQTT